ncbi:cupredoxin domain-containing protein [Paraconexibacter sp. AEG42_29]
MSFLAAPRTLLAVSLTSLVVLAGCGSDDDSGSGSTSTPAAAATSTPADAAPAQSGDVTIAYKDYEIIPEKVTVKAGTKLTWTNADATRHNVVTKEGAPEKFTSKDFDKGETDSFTPTKPGTYPYLCTFHAASMQGTITVVAG